MTTVLPSPVVTATTRTARRMRLLPAALALAVLLPAAGRAQASTWPDVEARVARDLGSSDVLARRAAAHDLDKIQGEAALPLVREALGDADPDVKLAGAAAALHLKMPNAADEVLPWLGDREARVRIAACDVLRVNPDPKATAQLGRALGDGDALVRAAAAGALGETPGADAVPTLLGHLDDTTPAVRVAVVHALAHKQDPRAITPLIGKIQDAAPEMRQAVARALGDAGELRATPALVLLLRDGSQDVRAEALRALARLHATAAIDPIATLLSDRSPWTREAAAAALGRMATADAVRRLVTALGTEERDAAAAPSATPVRAALVHAGPVATTQLEAALDRGSSPGASAGAAWVFGARGDTREAKRVVSAFRRGLLTPADALHALAGVGGSDELPVVLESIADPSPVVRGEALAAAARILDPAHPDGRAVEPLAAALTTSRLTTAERARVAELLGRTGAPRAAALLVPLAGSADPELRMAAFDGLALLGPPTASPAPGGSTAADLDASLTRGIADPDARIRLHAAAALASAGGDGARARLVRALTEGDEMDRAALTLALGGVVARHPDADVSRAVLAAFELAGGADRDALLPVLAALPTSEARGRLTRLVDDGTDDDRRALATVLPLIADEGVAVRVGLRLVRDTDPRVRAQAAWALASLAPTGTDAAKVTSELEARLTDSHAAVVAHAALGLARVRSAAPGDGSVGPLARSLCTLLRRPEATVRADALTGLRELGARCGAGDLERALVADDVNEDVRFAAARLVLTVALDPTSPVSADRRALERCLAEDPSPLVAEGCDGASLRAPAPRAVAAGSANAGRRAPLTIYVVPSGRRTPERLAPYVVRFADGSLRAGTADRRGAFVEPRTPPGSFVLRAVEADEIVRRVPAAGVGRAGSGGAAASAP